MHTLVAKSSLGITATSVLLMAYLSGCSGNDTTSPVLPGGGGESSENEVARGATTGDGGSSSVGTGRVFDATGGADAMGLTRIHIIGS